MKGRTISKVMGGWGKTKKLMQGGGGDWKDKLCEEEVKKKISAEWIALSGLQTVSPSCKTLKGTLAAT